MTYIDVSNLDALIGKRVRELRKSLEMSQEELGARIGASRQSVSNWENGKSSLSTDLIVRLSDVLRTTPNALLLGAKERTESVMLFLGCDDAEFEHLKRNIIHDREEYKRLMSRK